MPDRRSDIDGQFGDWLRDLRMDLEWTLQQLSNVTGYPPATLSRIENKVVEPHPLTITKLRNKLDPYDKKRVAK